MTDVFLSIGSNIDRDRNVSAALRELKLEFEALKISSVYESAAVGFEGERFYNIVVQFKSSLAVAQIADTIRQIEIEHGRNRKCRKFSARTLDIDLILYGDWVGTEGKHRIPRDDIINYGFVLEPLAEIAPRLYHPVFRKSYTDLWAEFEKSTVDQHRVYPEWMKDFQSND